MNSKRALVELIETYHELNSSTVDELPTIPTALTFLRYVARNRPFVVRNGAQDWKATQSWNARYLREVMHSQKVNVAVTPFGNADAVVEDEHGRLIFVEPYETEEDFGEFLGYVQRDSVMASVEGTPQEHVKYAQTRTRRLKQHHQENDNLRAEYAALFADIPPSISFATAALEQAPDAINFWLGNARSTTALHKDNYENIYAQIRGRKHFVLLPPVEAACVHDQMLKRGRYEPSADGGWGVVMDEAEPVPVATWDPEVPGLRPSEFSRHSRPMRVTLEEGDIMYLPALWYHRVGQSSGEEGFACSVNYWYDMSFDGGFWATQAFLRDVVASTTTMVEYPDLVMGDDDGEGVGGH